MALVALREDAGLSQQDLADALCDRAASRYGKHPGITKKTVGRWERGEVDWPQPFYRRLLAEHFDCGVDELGFRRPQRTAPAVPASDELPTLVAAPSTVEPHVEQDQHRWREIREAMGKCRRRLAVAAEQLYPDAVVPGLERTGVIAHPSWIPAQPVPLASVVLDLDEQSNAPTITGSERESRVVRPLASADRRYRRYSHAVRDLASPRLFGNRLCFRVLGVDWTLPVAQLQFGVMGFFDSIDINEALAHEMALHHMTWDSRGEVSVTKAAWRRLAFRRLVGDPFDLSRRPLMGAIGTLTIRGGESPSMVLHHRNGGRVAGGGNMGLLPAGIFEPSSVLPDAIAADFSIWRNIQREYAEELLGCEECDGSGRPIDYANVELFATMDDALPEGRIRVYCLGLTLDALTLCGDLLTVAVIEPDLFDNLFQNAVVSNAEGSMLAQAVPFEAHTIDRLRELQQLSPGACAAIHLAWQHRKVILGQQPASTMLSTPPVTTQIPAAMNGTHSSAYKDVTALPVLIESDFERGGMYRRTLLQNFAAGTGVVFSAAMFSGLEQIEQIRRELERMLEGSELGPATIDHWETLPSEYSQRIVMVAPDRLLNDIAGDFVELRYLLGRQNTTQNRKTLANASGQLAVLAGICLHHMGRNRGAQAWFRTAELAAREAQDRKLTGFAVMRSALNSLYYDAPQRTLKILAKSQALLGPAATPWRAMALVAQARTLATLGRSQEAQRCLADAENAFQDMPASALADPGLGYTERTYYLTVSNAYTRMGLTDEADAWQRSALRSHEPTEYQSRALIQLDQAHCMLNQGDITAACQHATQTITAVPPEYQGLIRQYGRKFLEQLPQASRSDTATRELRELLREESS